MEDLDQLAEAGRFAGKQGRSLRRPAPPRNAGGGGIFRLGCLLILGAALATGALGWKLNLIHIPGDSGGMEPLLNALEKVKADVRNDVSTDRLADDVATAKAEESKLEHTSAFSRRSFGHLMEAVRKFEEVTWELQSADRRERDAKTDISAEGLKVTYESMRRNREAASVAAKDAAAEMGLARDDLRAGR